MSTQVLSTDALAKIRGLSDAALVSVFRSTRLRQKCAGYTLLMEAMANEIRRRPHIRFDGFTIEGFDGDDGYGSMPRGKSKGWT